MFRSLSRFTRVYSKRQAIYTVLLQSLTDEQKFHLSGKVRYGDYYVSYWLIRIVPFA